MHCNVYNPKYMGWACSLLLIVISLTSGWIWSVWHPRQHVHVVTRATLPKVNKSQADWSRISPPSLYWLGHKTDRCKVLQGVNNLKWWYLQATTKRPKGGLQWNFDVWICVQVTAKHQPPLFGSCEKCFFSPNKWKFRHSNIFDEALPLTTSLVIVLQLSWHCLAIAEALFWPGDLIIELKLDWDCEA